MKSNLFLLCIILIVFSVIAISAFPPSASAQEKSKQTSVKETQNDFGISNVKVKKIADGRVIHRFFDTTPLSPSGRYLALFRFPFEDRAPKPGEAGEVILVDIKTGKESVVAKSMGWEVQLGANVQWGATDKELYFNDVDPSTWEAFAVQLNPLTGAKKRMSGTVFMVSNDGKKLASYNLISSRYAQVGYGVVIPDDLTPHNIGAVANDGIYITDVASNKTKMLVSIRDIYEKTIPAITISNPEDFEYYIFQAKWNPQGTKLLATIQWSQKGVYRKRSVITMNADGTDIRTAITNEQWSKGGHHINWTPDGEHLSMNLNVDGIPGLEIITVKPDGSDMKVVYPKGSGHPSFNPKGVPFMITDAYHGEMTTPDGKEPIRLMHIATGTEEMVASVSLSDNPDFGLRVDAHPAWDRSGRYVIFNGYEGKTRNVYIADLKDALAGVKLKDKKNRD